MTRTSSNKKTGRTVKTTAVRAKSIQAEPGRGRGHKSHVAKLNDKTRQTAYRHGMKWTDDEVEVLVAMIESDETTFDMAIRLERTYYSAQLARSHAGFALRHQNVLLRAANKAKRKPR